jgi:hypothetical protein
MCCMEDFLCTYRLVCEAADSNSASISLVASSLMVMSLEPLKESLVNNLFVINKRDHFKYKCVVKFMNIYLYLKHIMHVCSTTKSYLTCWSHSSD